MAKSKKKTKSKSTDTKPKSTSRNKAARNNSNKKLAGTLKNTNGNTGDVGESKTSQPEISVCDIMKENTSRIIKKTESQIPVTIQLYSDLYRGFLHSLDDMFGACYVSEKRFVDNLGLDNATLQHIDKSWQAFADIAGKQIDTFTQISRAHAEWLKTMTNFYDELAHTGMDYYAKTLDAYTRAIE